MNAKGKSNFSRPRSARRVLADALAAIGRTMKAIAGRSPPTRKSEPPARSRLTMRPHYGKLADVMLCLLHEAERIGLVVTTYELVKAVFLADRSHLNIYGRPITFDRYLAMRHGPVGHTFYNMLKEDPVILRATGPVQWKRRPAARPRRRYWADNDTIFEFHAPARPVDLEYTLSESDVEELEKALHEVKRLGVSGVWRRTHRDPAWKSAFRSQGDKKSYPIDPALLFDTPNAEKADELALFSHHNW